MAIHENCSSYLRPGSYTKQVDLQLLVPVRKIHPGDQTGKDPAIEMRESPRIEERGRGHCRFLCPCRKHHHARCLITMMAYSFLSAIAISGPAARQATQTPNLYPTAASVLALSREQATKGGSALLRGVVTKATDFGLVVQDRTGGVWVYWNRPSDFVSGDEVEVQGIVIPGLFAPAVNARMVKAVGRAPLPQAKKVSFKQLSAGDMSSQYVSIIGLVRSAGIRPGVSKTQQLWLKVAMTDGLINVTFPAEDAVQGNRLIGARVRINAPAGCTKNAAGQILFPIVSAPGMSSVTVLRPPPKDMFAVPLIPIGRLMQYRSGTDYYHRARVSGTVTYSMPGQSLILQDDGHALLVKTDQISGIRLGDRIEALGFPSPGISAPILEDALLRRRASGQQLQPTLVRMSDLSSGAINYNLVSVEGRLLHRVDEPSREVLVLRDRSTLLLAELAKTNELKVLQRLQEGSTVRVSGISMVDVEGSWNVGGPDATVVRCKVLLRSADDVHVLTPPSWWTTQHAAYTAAVLAIFTLACLVLVTFGRMKHLRLQAIFHERERLAHDIHDTLAQSFAGIGFQLQALRRAIPDELSTLRDQLDLTRTLVRRSHQEARRSLGPADTDLPEGADLLSVLENSARRMVEGSSTEVKAINIGVPRHLPQEVVAALVRIGQEAIANALRHADPRQLKISLAYEKQLVRLVIVDDGVGFIESGDLLGFGLGGMRKRSAAIAAKLHILSVPGKGTSIAVMAPVPPDSVVVTFLKQAGAYLSENIFHVREKQPTYPDSHH
jgi:signal transduction histidine kinase